MWKSNLRTWEHERTAEGKKCTCIHVKVLYSRMCAEHTQYEYTHMHNSAWTIDNFIFLVPTHCRTYKILQVHHRKLTNAHILRISNFLETPINACQKLKQPEQQWPLILVHSTLGASNTGIGLSFLFFFFFLFWYVQCSHRFELELMHTCCWLLVVLKTTINKFNYVNRVSRNVWQKEKEETKRKINE